MLDAFKAENRKEIISRCRLKMVSRPTPAPTSVDLAVGNRKLLNLLIESLLHRTSPASEIDKSGAEHARNLQLEGFTIPQVVYDYDNVRQSTNECAPALNACISRIHARQRHDQRHGQRKEGRREDRHHEEGGHEGHVIHAHGRRYEALIGHTAEGTVLMVDAGMDAMARDRMPTEDHTHGHDDQGHKRDAYASRQGGQGVVGDL